MPHVSIHERRRHRRIAFDAPIRLSTIDPEIDPHTGRPFFRAWEDHCTNVSRGGVLVHTKEALAPGRRVLIEVELPEGPRLEAMARVAWRGPAEDDPDALDLGIEFMGGRADQMSRLEKLLDRNSHTAL